MENEDDATFLHGLDGALSVEGQKASVGAWSVLPGFGRTVNGNLVRLVKAGKELFVAPRFSGLVPVASAIKEAFRREGDEGGCGTGKKPAHAEIGFAERFDFFLEKRGFLKGGKKGVERGVLVKVFVLLEAGREGNKINTGSVLFGTLEVDGEVGLNGLDGFLEGVEEENFCQSRRAR